MVWMSAISANVLVQHVVCRVWQYLRPVRHVMTGFNQLCCEKDRWREGGDFGTSSLRRVASNGQEGGEGETADREE